MAYHINDKGDAGKCSAKRGKCPFGDSSEHYGTAEEARAAYEAKQPDRFSAVMDHTPRPNWVEVDDRKAQSVFTNYRRVLKNLRSLYQLKSTAAEMKQEALKATSEKFQVPISQVKSIVQIKMAEAKLPAAHEDPQRQKLVAYYRAAEELFNKATVDDEGNLVCRCGSIEHVRLRPDPYEAEINQKLVPTLVCLKCNMDAAAEA